MPERSPLECDRKLASYALAPLLAASMCFSAPAGVHAQSTGCTLTPDDRNPSEKVLRCGDQLTIRTAPNTRYRLTGQQREEQPTGAHLDVGALLIEFKPREGRRSFQISDAARDRGGSRHHLGHRGRGRRDVHLGDSGLRGGEATRCDGRRPPAGRTRLGCVFRRRPGHRQALGQAAGRRPAGALRRIDASRAARFEHFPRNAL